MPNAFMNLNPIDKHLEEIRDCIARIELLIGRLSDKEEQQDDKART